MPMWSREGLSAAKEEPLDPALSSDHPPPNPLLRLLPTLRKFEGTPTFKAERTPAPPAAAAAARALASLRAAAAARADSSSGEPDKEDARELPVVAAWFAVPFTEGRYCGDGA